MLKVESDQALFLEPNNGRKPLQEAWKNKIVPIVAKLFFSGLRRKFS